MPLLEVIQTRQVSAVSGLTNPPQLRSISTPLSSHASADDVIEQALTYVFSKDRDFQEF